VWAVRAGWLGWLGRGAAAAPPVDHTGIRGEAGVPLELSGVIHPNTPTPLSLGERRQRRGDCGEYWRPGYRRGAAQLLVPRITVRPEPAGGLVWGPDFEINRWRSPPLSRQELAGIAFEVP
jgi:hypothetical protein